MDAWIAWIYEFMDIWIHGFVSLCIYGCIDIWMYVWMGGYIHVWMDRYETICTIIKYVCMFIHNVEYITKRKL